MTATGSKSIADNESLRISGVGRHRKARTGARGKDRVAVNLTWYLKMASSTWIIKNHILNISQPIFLRQNLDFPGGYHSIHMYPSQLMLTSGFQAVLCATWYAHPVQGRSMEVMVMRKSEPSICTVPANYAFGWDTYPSAISWFMVYIFVCIYYGIYI